MSLEGGEGEGRGGEGRGGEGKGREGGGEGSPLSHFGDILKKHFCCAILDDVTLRLRERKWRKDVMLALIFI